MAGTGRAGERPVATGSPASNSSKLPEFNPTIVAYVVCPGQLHALAENGKFHLPLSDITDSWNPRIGQCISQGSARETEPAGMCIRRLTARNRLVHLGGESETPSARQGDGRASGMSGGCVHGRDFFFPEAVVLSGLPAA